MMKSDTIESLITAVGGGYGEEFDVSKVRYHKVIIMPMQMWTVPISPR